MREAGEGEVEAVGILDRRKEAGKEERLAPRRLCTASFLPFLRALYVASICLYDLLCLALSAGHDGGEKEKEGLHFDDVASHGFAGDCWMGQDLGIPDGENQQLP